VWRVEEVWWGGGNIKREGCKQRLPIRQGCHSRPEHSWYTLRDSHPCLARLGQCKQILPSRKTRTRHVSWKLKSEWRKASADASPTPWYSALWLSSSRKTWKILYLGQLKPQMRPSNLKLKGWLFTGKTASCQALRKSNYPLGGCWWSSNISVQKSNLSSTCWFPKIPNRAKRQLMLK